MGIKCTKCGYLNYTTALGVLEYAHQGCCACNNHDVNTFIQVDKEDIQGLPAIITPPPITAVIEITKDCPDEVVTIFKCDDIPILVYDRKNKVLKALVRFQAAGMDIKVEPPTKQEVTTCRSILIYEE